MLHDVLASHAFVGFLGAFWFAGPKVGFDVFAARRRGEPWGDRIVMGLLAVIGGTSAAFVTTDFFAAKWHIADTRTVAFTIGFAASLLREVNGGQLAAVRAWAIKMLTGGAA